MTLRSIDSPLFSPETYNTMYSKVTGECPVDEKQPCKPLQNEALLRILDGANLPKHPGARPMRGSTCIPSKSSQLLYPFKRHFRCAQAQPLLVFCWLVIAVRHSPDKGTLKGWQPYWPAKLPYWTTLRMVRLARWDAPGGLSELMEVTLHTLPPPADGVL